MKDIVLALRKSIISGSVLLLIIFNSFADEPEKELHTFATILENDYLYNPAPGLHQDRHYTAGLKMIYLGGGGEPAPLWARTLQLEHAQQLLPKVWIEDTVENYGMIFGQNIYTPEDDRATNAIPNDRPYAGWLYLGAVIQRRGTVTDWDLPVLESFEFDAGIIGPEAQGEFAQNTIHKWRHIREFSGWGNQLKTEPAFDFKYGRAWKLAFSDVSSRFMDFIPNVGADLGTVRVSGNAGLTARLGWNLPDSFGVQTVDSPIVLSTGRATGIVGAYIFAAAEGSAVGRNAFLDGNLYQKSAHIDKEPLVGDLVYGLGATIGKHLEGSWTFVTRSREFVGQKGYDQFGSINLRCKWGF
jgi:lipid A 3-O-deacylase